MLDAPAWSPDGTQIAYARFFGEWPPSNYTHRATIEVLDIATGERRTVLDAKAVPSEPPTSFEYPRWSPDGRSLVVNAVRWDPPEANITGMAIGVVEIGGPTLAMPRLITDWDMWAAYPDWSRTQVSSCSTRTTWPSRRTMSHRTCTPSIRMAQS